MWNIISSAYTLASLLWDAGRWVKRQNWKNIIMDFTKWAVEYWPGIALMGFMTAFVIAMLNIWV